MFHYGNEGDFGGIWFNLKPGNNRRLSFYALAKAYGGPAGAAGTNTPPTFSSFTVSNQTGVVAGSTFTVNAPATDPNGDAITYNVLMNSNYINKSGGLAADRRSPATAARSRSRLPRRSASGRSTCSPRTARATWASRRSRSGSSRRRSPAPTSPRATRPRRRRSTRTTATSRRARPSTATTPPAGRAAWTDNEWIQVDLGSQKAFTTVQLVWEAAFAKGYKIQTSNDGTTWTTADGGHQRRRQRRHGERQRQRAVRPSPGRDPRNRRTATRCTSSGSTRRRPDLAHVPGVGCHPPPAPPLGHMTPVPSRHRGVTASWHLAPGVGPHSDTVPCRPTPASRDLRRTAQKKEHHA